MSSGSVCASALTPQARVLFVTWDGPQSSYLEGLFFPILCRLRQHGYEFHVLQFTWGPIEWSERTHDTANACGIGYEAVQALRRPVTLGSLATAVFGARHIIRLARRRRIDILMPRSILPALTSLLALRSLPKTRLLFDADGLPIDERIDFAGASRNSPVTRLLFRIEAAAVRRASAVITRSHAAIPILLQRAGIDTSPDKFFRVANCRDETLFRPSFPGERDRVRQSLGITPGVPLMVHAGSSFTGKYRGDKILDFFKLVKRRSPDARLLLLSGEPEKAQALVRSIAPDLSKSCIVLRSPPNRVPLYLSACDLGVALVEPGFSLQGSSLLKVGEYLLCGLPVVATSGVGDAGELLPPDVCFFANRNSPSELSAAADWFCNYVLEDSGDLRRRARNAGMAHYSFDVALASYAEALRFAQQSAAPHEFNETS